MPEAFDAFERAAAVAARVQAPGRRLVAKISAAGACQNAPTLFLPGCNLACSHCWAGPGRQDPRGQGSLRTYASLRREIVRFRRHNRLETTGDWIRLSGGEPVLAEEFFELVDSLLSLPGKIYVETNATLLGSRPDWLRRLIAYGPRVRLNISVKAGTGNQYRRITGADSAAWEATFCCLARLWEAEVPFELNALSRAPELFSTAERVALLTRLASIHPDLTRVLVEEVLTGYPRPQGAWPPGELLLGQVRLGLALPLQIQAALGLDDVLTVALGALFQVGGLAGHLDLLAAAVDPHESLLATLGGPHLMGDIGHLDVVRAPQLDRGRCAGLADE